MGRPKLLDPKTRIEGLRDGRPGRAILRREVSLNRAREAEGLRVDIDQLVNRTAPTEFVLAIAHGDMRGPNDCASAGRIVQSLSEPFAAGGGENATAGIGRDCEVTARDMVRKGARKKGLEVVGRHDCSPRLWGCDCLRAAERPTKA